MSLTSRIEDSEPRDFRDYVNHQNILLRLESKEAKKIKSWLDLYKALEKTRDSKIAHSSESYITDWNRGVCLFEVTTRIKEIYGRMPNGIKGYENPSLVRENHLAEGRQTIGSDGLHIDYRIAPRLVFIAKTN